MLDIDIPMAGNTKTANSYTLLFARIAALYPALGITQATHFVKTIKHLPSRFRPDRSIAIIGKLDDPMWEQRFRYDRYPISRYLGNPVFSVAELPVVQAMDEVNLLTYLTNKFNMGFHPRDFAIRAAGIQYTGGEVPPNWRIFSLPGSPLWYTDQVIWLHGGTGGGPGPIDPEPPTGLTIVTDWAAPFTNPYVDFIMDETKIYTEFYWKATGLWDSVRASMDVTIGGGYTVDYTRDTGQVLFNEHLPIITGTGLTKYDEWYLPQGDDYTQYDINNQGINAGYVNVYTDTYKGRAGWYTAMSNWNENPPLGAPHETEGVVPRTADFYGSVPFIVSRLPYMVEAGFRPTEDIPDGSKWVDNMGLPGAIACFFGTDGNSNNTFDGPLAGFTGVVKRGTYGKRAAELDIADIRCGILYRDGVGQVIISGNVVFERTVAYETYMFFSAFFDFVTLGNDGVAYTGIAGMQTALETGKISAPFQNIRAACTQADIHMGGTSTYTAIKDGVWVTRTRTGYNSATDVPTATPNPNYAFSLADSVFYTVNDCVYTAPQYGIRSYVEHTYNYDKELMVSRVITP